MQNITKFTMQAMLLSVCLTGCQQRTFVMDESETDDVRIPVVFSGTIQTRLADNEWEADDKIGIFMFKTRQDEVADAVIDNSNNRKYSYSAENNFTPCTKNDALYYPQEGNVDFVSYYPYSAVEECQLKLDVSVQEDPVSIDLLYSNNLINIEKGKTQHTLQFTHRLSKVVFNISAGTDFDSGDLSGLKLSVEDIAASATLNVFTNELTLAPGANKAITAKTNEAGTLSEAILLPQTCAGKKVKIVLANRRTYTFIIGSTVTSSTNGGDTQSTTSDASWEAAYKYTYNIELNRDYYSVESISASISEWTDKDPEGLSQSGSSTLDASIWDGTTSNIDWYSASESSFDISTAEQFAGFSELVNSGISFEEKTVNLLSDVDLNSKEWTPIGYNKAVTFKGTFNGGNHTVNGVSPVIQAESQAVGLFGDNSGVIKDVIVSGTVTYSGDEVATVCLGGVVGINRGTIEGCRNYASVSGVNAMTEGKINIYLGGIAGYHTGSGTIEDCQNQGVIEGENVKSESSTVAIGGIAGWAEAGVENCENDQSVRCKGLKSYAGGIIGCFKAASTISNCYNYGSVTIEDAVSISMAGGIVGYMPIATGCVSGSYNYAEVTANIANATEYAKAGGIVGHNYGGQITSNTNNGAVTATNSETAGCSAAGGVVGYNLKEGAIHLCTNGTNGSAQSGGVYGCIAGFNSTAEDEVGYVYSCCTNKGTPLKWIGSATENGSLAGVADSEHTDE